MPKYQCSAEGCEEQHKPWSGGAVSDFKRDNLGWMYVMVDTGGSEKLCPEHAVEAARLALALVKLCGRYCVNAVLRGQAKRMEESGALERSS